MAIITRNPNVTLDKIYNINYFNIRNSAWDFLIKNEVTSYPLDLHKIIAQNNWRVVSYSSYSKLKELSLEDVYKISPDGFTDVDDDNHFIIAINGQNNEQRNRFTICHEIGHIMLHKVFRDEKRLEKEANMFAARILMPMLLIRELNITRPEDLANLCNVSIESASYRLKRYNAIIGRDKFYTSPLEVKVYNQLSTFINYKKIGDTNGIL